MRLGSRGCSRDTGEAAEGNAALHFYSVPSDRGIKAIYKLAQYLKVNFTKVVILVNTNAIYCRTCKVVTALL